MKKKIRERVISFISILSLLLLWVAANVSIAAGTEVNKTTVKVPMSDGVHLVADLYIPSGEKKYPTILIRGPYGSQGLASIGEGFAQSDYTVIIQNVRGTGGSEGQFFPFVSEKKDGLDTLDWIASQHWSNGKVGIWGVSYLGYAGLILTPANHPALVTMINISGFADMDEFFAPGGAFNLMAHLPWIYINMTGRRNLKKEEWDQVFRTTPLTKLFGPADQGMENVQSLGGEFDKVKIPIFHITGWHDYIYPNVLTAYNSIPKNPQAFQKLLVGPWWHNQIFNDKSGEGLEDHSEVSVMGIEKLIKLSVRWFDHWFKGKDSGILDEAPVKLFVMGKNEWIDSPDWPLSSTSVQKWYLSSKKGANSSKGDGILSRKVPYKAGTDIFIYDPLNSAPTKGGAKYPYTPDYYAVADQIEVEKREDILVYTSPIIKEGLEIIGPVRVVLYASTEAKDTDFMAKLVEFQEDGISRNIVDGIIRARYRDSRDNPTFLEPGIVYTFDINLGATAIYLKPGSRLRLDISSSNFPKFDRNPNTGVDPFDAVEFKKVKQIIYFSKKNPSHLLLHTRKHKHK